MTVLEIGLIDIARLPNDKSRDWLLAAFRREQLAQERAAREKAAKARKRDRNAGWVAQVHAEAKAMLEQLEKAEGNAVAPDPSTSPCDMMGAEGKTETAPVDVVDATPMNPGPNRTARRFS